MFFAASIYCQDKNIVPADKVASSSYKYLMEDGKLKLNTNQVAYGKISNKEIKTDTVEIFNQTDSVMKLSFDRVPEYVTIKCNPSTIKPQTTANLIVTISPELYKDETGKQKWGNTNTNIGVIVNGNVANSNKNLFFISALIEEDFSKYTKKELARAPIIEFETKNYDFGKVKQGTQAKYDFVFYNRGKEDLEIRSVKAG